MGKPTSHREQIMPDVTPDQYLVELSAAAQRAEMRGDRIVADAVHREINHELDCR